MTLAFAILAVILSWFGSVLLIQGWNNAKKRKRRAVWQLLIGVIDWAVVVYDVGIILGYLHSW